MSKSITDIFNQFVGREVSLQILIPGMPIRRVREDDPVAMEMERLASEKGLDFAIEAPECKVSTFIDNGKDRVIVYTEEGPDGKCRVSNKIELCPTLKP